MQEMEAICTVLAAYAVNEAQKSGVFISSLKPYYRLRLLSVSNKTKFKVMDLSRQDPGTLLHQIPRKTKKVEQFTEGGEEMPRALEETNSAPPTRANCKPIIGNVA